jgi:uncharacterized protein YjdB
MMKSSKILIVLPVLSLLISSCYSPKLLVDDDVYVLKSNELPVGESLNDETSYATFKNKQNAGMVSSNYYNNFDDLSYYPLCRNASYFYMGCGCSFYAYSHFYSNRPYNQFGYSPYFYSPNAPFGYDPFYNSMGFYNPYGYNPYGFNPYGGYGYGYGNYGNTSYNPGTVTTNYNHHSGPRGTSAGFGNPSGRPQGNTVKSTFASTPTNKPIHQSTVSNRKIDPTLVVGQTKPVRPSLTPTSGRITTSKPIHYTSTSDRGVRSTTSGSSTISNSGRTNSPSRGGSIGGNESGGRVNSGTISGGSRGGSSGTSGGSSGGRSGGGSPSNSGRRN